MTAPQRVRLRWCLFLLLALIPGMSCANAEYRKAYAEVVERELEAYRHQGDTEAVRADVGAFMVAQGYVPLPAEGAKLESDWREQGEIRDRMRAVFIPARGGQRIQVYVEEQTLSPARWGPDSNERRADLERKVLERVDPELAETVKAETGTDGVVFTAPAANVWETMTKVGLEESHVGFGFDPVIDVNSPSMWSEDQEAGERHRLEVRLNESGKGRHTLEIRERVEKMIGQRRWTHSRDERHQELELELIAHRDPSEGERIKREADQAGRDAYDDAVDRGYLITPRCHCN